MADVFNVIEDAVQSEIDLVQKRLDVLSVIRGASSRKVGVFRNLIAGIVSAVRSLLGQFSNRKGYSDAEIRTAAENSLTAAQSNAAGNLLLAEENLPVNSDDVAAQGQEAVNRLHTSMISDPLNVFALPRIVYDNMTSANVSRISAINEALEAIGYIKLLHDAIPPEFYVETSLSLLSGAKPFLEEVVRTLKRAGGAVAADADPEQLVRSAENDLESLIRHIGRESVFRTSQFSAEEYLSWINRLKAAADLLETHSTTLTTARENIDNLQTSFVANYKPAFSEMGALSSAAFSVQAVVDQIEQLEGAETVQPESLAISASRDIVLKLCVELANVKSFVRKKAVVDSALTVQVSTERTKFEASQAALAAVPDLSPTLANDLRTFARLAEKRITSQAVSPLFASTYATVASALVVEYGNSSAVQSAMNDYDVDITVGNKLAVLQAFRDLREFGLDRIYDGMLSGSLDIVFDTDATRAARVGYAIQETALAIERALSGVASIVGDCKLSQKLSQRKVSSMLAELQEQLRVRAFAQVNVRDFVDKRIRELSDRKLKRLYRYLEELASIRLAEKC